MRAKRLAVALCTIAIIAGGPAAGQGDGVGMVIGADATVSLLTVAGTEVSAGVAPCPLVELADVTREREFAPGRPDGEWANGRPLAFEGLEAEAAVTVRNVGEGLRFTVHLKGREDLPARGVLLRLNFPVNAHGWRWHDDMQTAREIGPSGTYENVRALRAWPDLPEWTDRPSLRVGSANRNFATVLTGEVGLALAVPMDRMSIHRTAYDAEARLLQIVYDLALSPDTDPANEWTFEFDLYACDPEWGFRDAVQRYYEMYLEFFEVYYPDAGMWMAFTKLSQIDNVNEFRFGLQEGAPEVAYDDMLGVLDTIYLTHAGQFARIPGHDPEREPLPPYERLLEVMSETFERATGQEGMYEAVGLFNAEGRYDIQQTRVYGHIIAQFNQNPDLPYGAWTLDEADRRTASILERTGGRLDGFYYDGLSTGLNYRTEHFAMASHPPMWDPVAEKPVLNNFFSSCEFARAAAEQMRPQDQITMMNGAFGASFYVAPWLDAFGGETGLRISREQMNYLRSVAHHKPILTLLKGNFEQVRDHDEILLFHKRCLAYGIFPGFFDWSPSGLGPGGRYWDHPSYYERDRDILRKYQPLVQTLSVAGWEPVTHARSSNASVPVERFGPGEDGIVWLTLLNEDAAPLSTRLVIDAPALGIDAAAVRCMDIISERAIDLSRDGGMLSAEIEIEADGVMMLQIATPAQATGWRLGQARDAVELGRTMREVDAQTERDAVAFGWHVEHDGYGREEIDEGHSLVLDGTDRGSLGAWQWVMLFQPEAAPATIRVRVAAEDVAGEGFVRLMARHAWVSPSFSHYEIAQFDLPKGTYEWQDLEFTISIDQPLRAIYLRPEMHGDVSGRLRIASITVEDSFRDDYVVNPQFTRWYEPLSDALREVLDTHSAALLAAIDEAASAADRDTLLAIAAQTTATRAWIVENGAENPCRRMLRDLETVEGHLAPALLSALGIAPPTLDAPARIAAGDEVPIGFAIGAMARLPVPVSTSITVAGPGEVREVAGRHALRVPADAPVGETLALTGEALVGPAGGAVPIRATRQVAIVAPLEVKIAPQGTDDSTGAMRVGATVRNNRLSAIEARLAFEAPDGWSPPEPRTLRLEAGATERLTALIEPREGARAGSVQIAVNVAADEHRAEDVALMLYIPAEANLLRNPGFEDELAGWHVNATGEVALDQQVSWGGEASVRLRNTDRAQRSQVSQSVTLNQEQPCAVMVRTASRGEQVVGAPGRSWSLWVDVYYTDGDTLYGQAFSFATDTDDWQLGELIIEPRKPIRSLTVNLLLRDRSGTVWFDDVAVMEDPRRKGNIATEATVQVDSSYSGYHEGPINDGIVYPAEDAHWTDKAWASAETDGPHWIELSFEGPRTVDRAAIWWSLDGGIPRTSREVRLQVPADDGWRDVAILRADETAVRSEINIDAPVSAERFRFFQPGGEGSQERRNLMWVREVELFETH